VWPDPAPDVAAGGRLPGIRFSPAAAEDLVSKHPPPSAIDGQQRAISASGLSSRVSERRTLGAVKTKGKTVANIRIGSGIVLALLFLAGLFGHPPNMLGYIIGAGLLFLFPALLLVWSGGRARRKVSRLRGTVE